MAQSIKDSAKAIDSTAFICGACDNLPSSIPGNACGLMSYL